MARMVSVLCMAASLLYIFAAIPDSRVDFVDVAPTSGLTLKNVYGGLQRKDYILETTGNGVAIFDYDGDGANDIFIANGTRLAASNRAAMKVGQALSPGQARALTLPAQFQNFGSPGSKPNTSVTSNRAVIEGSGPSSQNIHLYHNDGKGRFTEVGAKAGFRETGWAQGFCVGDYDNDSYPDLLLTYYGHNILYRNRGNGTFEDVTAKAKLPVAGVRYGSGCSFFDYDRDGHLDLFVSNYVDLDLAKTPKPGENNFCEWKGIPVMCGPRGLPLARNLLYHNNGDGTFTDVSEKSGILKPGGRYGLGVIAADFDNDGWPDIYVACDMTPSLLFQNLHNGTFAERGVEAGVAYNFDGQLQAGMGIAVGDYDGDGLLDIAKTNFSGDLTSLFRNEDGKFFSDVSREAGLSMRQLLGWGIVFTDVDDDGWKDLITANGHVYPEVENAKVGDKYRQETVLYKNLGAGKFLDITSQAGPAFQQTRPARGLAVGDLDSDGRPEIVIVNMNDTPSLLKNRGSFGHFLNVAVVGTKSNRSGIGARVTITAGGKKMIDEVMSGGSFYSQNSLTLHFGLGNQTTIDQLEVRWPNGSVQVWKNLPADRLITATEGKSDLKVMGYTGVVQ